MYALHSTDELERQLRQGQPLNPIKEEKTFDVKGLILHMEFLHPSPGDHEHVILLLFVIESASSPSELREFPSSENCGLNSEYSSNRKSRLKLFEWWTSKPLHTAARHGHHGFRLPDGNIISCLDWSCQ